MTVEHYFPYAFFEEKIVPIEDARINIMTNALQYGTGVFGGIRGYMQNDKSFAIFRLLDHCKRLCASVSVLGKTVTHSETDLAKIILNLAQKNHPTTDFYLRPFIYASDWEISPNLAGLTMKLAIYMIPLAEYLPVNRGLSLIVSNWTRITDNAIPSRAKITGGYVNSSLAKAEAAAKGCDEAVMLNQKGTVAEASAANLFIVRNGVLVTPSNSDDILEGITRKTIIELARDLSIPIEVRSISRTELYVCDEAFLTGTGAQVAWAAKIDDRTVGTGKKGPITEKIQNLFFSAVRGKEKKYTNWLTAV